MTNLHLKKYILKGVCLITLSSINISEAAITFTFEETNGDVVATLSGSFDTTGLTPGTYSDPINYGYQLSTIQGELWVVRGDHDGFRSIGSLTRNTTTNFSAPSSSTSGSFGAFSDQLIIPADSISDTTINGSGTFTWSSATLSSIGLASLDSTPILYWSNSNVSSEAGSIQFVKASTVPEPSTFMFLGTFTLFGLLNRSRK